MKEKMKVNVSKLQAQYEELIYADELQLSSDMTMEVSVFTIRSLANLCEAIICGEANDGIELIDDKESEE